MPDRNLRRRRPLILHYLTHLGYALRGVVMMLFFLHVRDGDAVFADEAGSEFATLDAATNRVTHASPGAWRYLGWRWFDPDLGRLRLLPAETFGPLPS